MKRLIRSIFTIAIVAALAAGGYWLYRNKIAPQATAKAAGTTLTQTVAVRQGNLSSTISVVGQLDADQLQSMAFSRLNGATKLLKLEVAAGNTVKAGQTLASVDPAPYKQALEQAQSALQAAQDKLTDLTTPATKLQIAKADLTVAKAQLQVQQSQSDLDDLVNPDMAALQSAVADAQRGLAQAQVSLATLQADDTVETNLTKLRDTEAKLSADYTRLATENTPDTDVNYLDRKQIALNKLKAAEDARITAETQKESNLLKAQTQVKKSEKALADAQDALATAQAGGDKLALAKDKVAVQDAQVAVSTAQDSRTTLVAGTDATTLAAAQADVDKKKLAVADAEGDLAGTTLVAPFDGTILRTNVTVGNSVGPTTQILTIANMKTLQVVTSIDETTIRSVKVGQDATMTFDSFPGQTFRGKVLEVPLQGDLQGNVMVYEVPISLTGADNVALLVGMTSNVKVQVAQATNALLVPAVAVNKVGTGYQVTLASDDPQGQGKAVAVEIGLTDGTTTQITKGLNVGDKVLVQYTASTSTTTQNPFGQQFPGGGQDFPQIPGGGQPPVIIQGGGGAPGQ
jgi:HlyD family secretion protein